jgi:hypothetical protein
LLDLFLNTDDEGEVFLWNVSWLHDDIFRKIDLFITTSVRTSNLTYFCTDFYCSHISEFWMWATNVDRRRIVEYYCLLPYKTDLYWISHNNHFKWSIKITNENGSRTRNACMNTWVVVCNISFSYILFVNSVHEFRAIYIHIHIYSRN